MSDARMDAAVAVVNKHFRMRCPDTRHNRCQHSPDEIAVEMLTAADLAGREAFKRSFDPLTSRWLPAIGAVDGMNLGSGGGPMNHGARIEAARVEQPTEAG